MKRLFRCALAALSVFALASPLRAAEPPARIVVAGGVIAEIIHALGRDDRIAGADTTSQFPPEILKTRPGIGYLRALSAEGILSLRPDLLLALDSAGPPDTLALIRTAGVRVEMLPEDLSAEGVVRRIRQIGTIIGEDARAEALVAKVSAGFAALTEARGALKDRKRVLFVLSLQNGRVLAGGRDTSADAIIALAGADNAAAGIRGFKPISDEGIIAARPDVILMMNRGDHVASADDIFALAAFQAVPAARTRHFIAMDSLYLLGFGPRTPDAARALMRAIYGPGT